MSDLDRGRIERYFLRSLVEDRDAVVVLDGVDELPEGYLIRSHDLRGPLPEVLIPRLEGLKLRERVELEARLFYAVMIHRFPWT